MTEQQPQHPPVETKENLKPVHIVIIDDNTAFRWAFAENLSLFGPEDGYLITTRGYSSYTKETREYIMSELPEIVLIDLELKQGLSGDEISRQLRTEEYNGKIIFLTAYDANQISGTSRQMGRRRPYYENQ